MQTTKQNVSNERNFRMPPAAKSFGKWMGRTAGAAALVFALNAQSSQAQFLQSESNTSGKSKQALTVSVSAGGEKLALNDSAYVDGQKYEIGVGKKVRLNKYTDEEFGFRAFGVVPQDRINPNAPVLPIVGAGGFILISYSGKDVSASGSFSGDFMTSPGTKDFKWLTYWAASGDVKYGVLSISADLSKLYGGTWDDRIGGSAWNARALGAIAIPFYSHNDNLVALEIMGGPQLLSSPPVVGIITPISSRGVFRVNSYLVGGAASVNIDDVAVRLFGLTDAEQKYESGGSRTWIGGFRFDNGRLAVTLNGHILLGENWSKISTVQAGISYTIPLN